MGAREGAKRNGLGEHPSCGVMPRSTAIRNATPIATSDAGVCTGVCTSSPENANDVDLERLVEDLRARLSVDQCRRLAELLLAE